MKQMQLKKLLIMCLAVMLSVSMLPAGVFAVGETGQDNAVVNELGNNGEAGTPENGQPGNDQLGGENDAAGNGNSVTDGENDAAGGGDAAGDVNNDPDKKKAEEPAQKKDGDSSDGAIKGVQDENDTEEPAGPAGAPKGDENVTSLKVTVGSNDVSETHITTLCDRILDMTVVASLPQTAGTKSITVDVPTGWIVMGYSRLDSDTDHKVNLVSGNIGESKVAGEQIKIDNEYKDAIKSVTLDPNLDETVYGTVVCPSNKWEAQNLDGWSGSARARVFGGKLTYTLSEDAANVKLLIRVRPQPFIFPRTSANEEMPPVTVKLSSQHADEEPVVKTVTMETTATSMGVPKITWPNYESYNLSVNKEKSSVRFSINGHLSQWTATTGSRSNVSLADELTYTLTYPPGVFYSENQTGATPWGTIESVNEDSVNGGGTVVMKADHKILVHSNTVFKIFFEARAGEGTDFHPDCEKVWGRDKNPETFKITGTGTVTRAGEDRNLGTITYKRTVYIVDGGSPSYAITINSSTKTRRDLVKDYELDDYDILLASAGMTCKFGYNDVPFHFENEDNKLGITGIRMPGKNIRDLVIKTFRADGTEGRTITLAGPYGKDSWSSSSSGSHMIAGEEIGLEEGEYISEVYLTADLAQLTYSTTYLSGGIAFMGQYLDSTPGKVNISIVRKLGEGAYSDEVAPNQDTGDDIKGYAACKPGVTTVGAGRGSTVTSKTQGGGHNAIWYPNDVVYYRSTITTSSVTHTQDTLIDPVITIALPEGVDLQTTSVQGQSLAGNHKDNSWFDLKPVGSRQIEINGVTWNCYDYTSVNHLDMVANENATNEGVAGGTVIDAEQQMSVRFQAVISTTCPQYALYTQNNVLWYIGGGPEGNVSSGTGGEGFVTTDTANRMGLGTSAKAMIGKNQYSIKPLVGLGMDLAIRPEESPEADWLTWLGGDDTVATVHEGKPAEVKLTYISKSESEQFKDTIIYLPIPKKGECYNYLNNKELAAPVDVSNLAPFEFTANLTGPIKMKGIDDDIRWKTYYALSATSNDVKYDTLETDEERESWEPVIPTEWISEDDTANWGPDDWAKVAMVKFVALDDILPGKTGEAVFTMDIDPEAQFGSYDYWRGYGRAKLGGGANNWKYTSVVGATPTSATFLGQIFIDENVNAAFDNTGNKPEVGYGTNFTAELTRDDGATTPVTVTVADDGVMQIVDSEGRQIYLRMGDYTLTVTKSDEETVYDYEQIESGTNSSAEKWYNDIKNADVSGAKAKYKFTVDKSVEKTRSRAADSNIKAVVYYTGVGLAQMNDFSFKKLAELEGSNGSATNQPFAGAKFALYTDSACTKPAVRDGIAYEAISASDGKVEFKDIVAGTYYMKETELPSGSENTYFTNDSTYKVVVSNTANVKISRTVADADTGDITGSQKKGFSIINRQKTSISGIKIWNDGGANEHPSIVVDVIAEGADEAARTVEVIFSGEPEEGQVLATRNDDGSWSFTIDELRKFNDGASITYNIVEQALDGYVTTSDGNTITNTTATEATVKKVWNDGNNAARKRPSTLEFGLYQSVNGGNAVAVKGKDNKDVTVTLPVEGRWEKTIKDLPKYDANKDEITYSWKELSDLDNYKQSEPSVSGTVTTFTNTLLKQITVKKKWEVPDTKTTPDSVKVYLKGGSVEYSAELSENNEWKHTFGNTDAEILLAYDEQGNEIEYTVTEDEVANYSTEVGEPVVAEDKSVTITVTNTYEATGTLTLGGLKKLSVPSGKLVEGQFTFTVTDNGNEIATGTNDSEGNITFTPATVTYNYDKDNDDTGDHELVISETGEDGNGAKADAEDVKVTVTVSDNGDKTLAVSPDDITDSVVMTNTYETGGEITFSGKKTLKGDTLSAGQFSFELYDEDGELIESVSHDEDGNYSFETLKFTGDDLDKDADGNYTETTKEYKIVEKEGTDPQITYDETEYIVTVTLVDDGHGCINVTADPEEDSFDFINEYTPEKDKPGKGTKTGDDNHLMGWIALLLIAGAGGGVIAYRRRRRSN